MKYQVVIPCNNLKMANKVADLVIDEIPEILTLTIKRSTETK